MRDLLGAYPAIRDIEVRGAGLEEAFLELTRRRRGDAVIELTYLSYEVLRTWRNRRFLFSPWSSRWFCSSPWPARTATSIVEQHLRFRSTT